MNLHQLRWGPVDLWDQEDLVDPDVERIQKNCNFMFGHIFKISFINFSRHIIKKNILFW